MSTADLADLLKHAVWRKKRPWGSFAIVAYIALVFLVPRLGLPSVVSDVVVAPMYYLLPAGVGLLLLGINERSGSVFLGRSQLLVLSYFCGLFVITGLFVIRERHGILGSDPSVLFAVCVLSAMGGFVRQRHIFQPDASLWRFMKLYILLAFPLFLFRYLIHFGSFSDFPLTDLTQAGHLMKGAVEFARFDVLNPFTADSYLPVQQVVNGLMVRFFDFDLLVAEWLYPFMAEILRFTIVYSVISALTTSAWSRNLALAAAMVFMGGINSTNGELAALGSLLLLSLLIGKNVTGLQGSRLALSLAAILFGLGIAHLLAQVDAIVYLVIVTALILYATMPGNRHAFPTQIGTALILVFCLVPLHRSIVMFVPAVLGVAAVYALVKFVYHQHYTRMAAISLQTVSMILPVVVFGVATVILVSALNGEDETFGLLPSYEWIMHALLGTTIYTLDIMLGTGSKVALFELGHALSPLLMLVTFGLFAAVLIAPQFGAWMSRGARGTAPVFANPEQATISAIQASWYASWLLGFFILGGFPFVHRLSYLLTILFAVAFGELYAVYARANPQIRAIPLIFGVLFLAMYIVAYAGFFGFQPDWALVTDDYIRLVQPVATALTAVLILGLAAVVILAMMKRNMAIVLSATIIVVAMAWEKQISNAFYMRYAYGARIPDDAEAVSHYTRLEFAIADSLKHEPAGTVLVSDPFLMSILRARTGLNGIITYSNLDTMTQSTRKELQAVLRDLTENKTVNGTTGHCNVLKAALTVGNSSEFGYWLWRWTNPEGSGEKFLMHRGYSNSLVPRFQQTLVSPAASSTPADNAVYAHVTVKTDVKFFVVLTKKTLLWANTPLQFRTGYYPSYGNLDRGLVATLEKRFNATNIDDQAVLFRVNCPPAPDMAIE